MKMKSYYGYNFLIVLLISWIDYSRVSSCFVCKDDPSKLLANAEISLPGIYEDLVPDCGTLQGYLPAMEAMWDSRACGIVSRLMDTFCCSSTKEEQEILASSSCHICGVDDDNSNIPNKIPDEFIGNSIPIDPDELYMFDSDFHMFMEFGITPSCQILDGYGLSISNTDPNCETIQQTYGPRCGCYNGDGGGEGYYNNTNATIVETSNNNNTLVNDNNGGSNILDNDNYDETKCNICSKESDRESFKPDALDLKSKNVYDLPRALTCSQLVINTRLLSKGTNECYLAEVNSYLCGCNHGIRNNYGADTPTKHMILAWIPRITGLLSFIGSSLIIRDVTKEKGKKLRKSLLHQLVCCMSIFDVCSSIAFIFSTMPIPVTQYEYHTGVYGAMGTEQTCRIQGFFVQLGYTSALYNMVLSIYYLCVIKFRITESQLQLKKLWFHLPVLTVGFGLAFAGIPFYDNIDFFCHIQLPLTIVNAFGKEVYITNSESEIPVNVFSLIPISIVTAVATINMIIIYFHVWKQDRAANKWRFASVSTNRPKMERSRATRSGFNTGVTTTTEHEEGKEEEKEDEEESKPTAEKLKNGRIRRYSFKTLTTTLTISQNNGDKNDDDYNEKINNNFEHSRGSTSLTSDRQKSNRKSHARGRLTDSVFWQAVFYLGSFMMCWPIYYVAIFNRQNVWQNYQFWIALLTLYPLQGFLNAIVYFRIRIVNYWRKHIKKYSLTRSGMQSTGSRIKKSSLKVNRSSELKRSNISSNNDSGAYNHEDPTNNASSNTFERNT